MTDGSFGGTIPQNRSAVLVLVVALFATVPMTALAEPLAGTSQVTEAEEETAERSVQSQEQQGQNASEAPGGESKVVTFYGHVFDHTMASPMPANTEAPVGENIYGRGSFHYCTNQASFGLGPEGESCRQAEENKLALFSTAGFVDLESRTQWESGGEYAQLHNERGQTKDIQLDTDKPINATIYMTVDFHGWAVSGGETSCTGQPHPEDVPCLYPYWGWDAGVQPDYEVTATLYHAQLGEYTGNASNQPPVQEAWEGGNATVVAQGAWGPDTVTDGVPGTPHVNQFTIDMGTPQVDTIPKENDFFLVYSFQSNSSGQQWGVHTWRIWSGEFFPPSFTMPVENPFTVERVTPTFAHGKLALLGIMNTPWGSYDIDPDSVKLTVEGPDGQVTPEVITRKGDISVAHGGHYQPINFTWIWDYQQQDLPPGTYDVTVSAQNFQGSAASACTASFTLEPGEAQGEVVPGAVEPGTCGFQTISQERLQAIQRGAAEEAGG